MDQHPRRGLRPLMFCAIVQGFAIDVVLAFVLNIADGIWSVRKNRARRRNG
jgi:hypothetical protein